jgi:2-phosphoglycerate kinase
MASNKLILIGGTSHVGKSTLSQRLAEELGWNYLSTDQLARHPGRPWKVGDRSVPDDVVEHYTNLAVPELVDSVLQHYRSNVWPIIDAIIQSRLNNPFDVGLVLEGSAILPEQVCVAAFPRVNAIWLTAPDHLITERIKRNSNYGIGTSAERKLVDAFAKRTLEIDRILRDSVKITGQKLLDASSENTLAGLSSLA